MADDLYDDSRAWLSPAQLAAMKLPGLPKTKSALIRKAEREGWGERLDHLGRPLSRRRKGRGGGWLYHVNILGAAGREVAIKTIVFERESAALETAATGNGAVRGGKTAAKVDWAWYDRQTTKKKAKAEEWAGILDQVEALRRGGMRVNDAVDAASRKHRIGKTAIYARRKQVRGLDRKDWLPVLAPRQVGKTKTAACDPRAWAALKADYLRPSKPAFEACYERVKQIADARGWEIPSARTLLRRLEREIPKAVEVLGRQGADALAAMYPPQERDRSMFHALEAVNVDGHKFDVFVEWPDGTVSRPMLVAVQDLYSNKIVGWRIGRSESADLVRLAFKDVFERYGIPDHAWLDNGRGFASKLITGGAPSRYRFKVKPAEPSGVLTQLGVQVHWTTPYSGQSKPIERAFGDLVEGIAKHPKIEGAYTGNRPDAKPENYGSRAIPIELFTEIAAQGIHLHNARPGRRTRVCAGTLSFDQAFERSYADALIRKAGSDQLRVCLLAAESVRVDRKTGAVRLLGNRYWAEFLHDHLGQAVTVRFDPDALHDGVHLYRLDGGYIGFAECLEAAGFADRGAAREHGRKRRAFTRATREAAVLERELSLEEYAALLPEMAEPKEPAPDHRVVRIVGRGQAAAAAAAEPDLMTDEEYAEALSKGLRLVEGGRAGF